jgi:hypothetical protein
MDVEFQVVVYVSNVIFEVPLVMSRGSLILKALTSQCNSSSQRSAALQGRLPLISTST